MVFSAADAIALTPSPVPSQHQGMVVRGHDDGRVRAVDFEIERPELPKGSSFFTQQTHHEDTHG